MESLDAMKDCQSREAVKRDLRRAVPRRKVKKALLDALDEKYDFELPPSLVEQEFNRCLVAGHVRPAEQFEDLRG